MGHVGPSQNGVRLDENFALPYKQSRSCYLVKKGELRSLWEMQDVEDFKQTNEGNNEEGKKHLHVGTQHSNKNVYLVALKRE